MIRLDNQEGWIPIYKDSSLPYMEGDRFLVRRNDCDSFCSYGQELKCYKTRPCVELFRAHRTNHKTFPIKNHVDVEYWKNDCNSIYSTQLIFCMTAVVDMTAGDTCHAAVEAEGGTKVVGLVGSSSSDLRTYFQGYLVC